MNIANHLALFFNLFGASNHAATAAGDGCDGPCDNSFCCALEFGSNSECCNSGFACFECAGNGKNEARTKVLLRGAVRIDESGYDVASHGAEDGSIATSDAEWPGASEKSGDTSGDAGDGYCAPRFGICDFDEGVLCCGGEECCEALPEGSYPRAYTSLCSC